MLLNRDTILQRLREAKPFLQEKFQVNELALFGSYARNEQHDKSDIDILLSLNNKSFKNYLHLIESIETLFPDKEVQVVSKEAIKPQYFEIVKPDLIYA
jgi:predicted nucleotidyltransferase